MTPQEIADKIAAEDKHKLGGMWIEASCKKWTGSELSLRAEQAVNAHEQILREAILKGIRQYVAENKPAEKPPDKPPEASPPKPLERVTTATSVPARPVQNGSPNSPKVQR